MVYYIIAAYQNKRGDVLLNATATNEIGVNTSTNSVEILISPMNFMKLGETITGIFGNCVKDPYWSEDKKGSVDEFLGIKSYSEFRKEHLHVIITLDHYEKEYTLKPTKRKNNGYVSEGKDYMILSTESNYDSLGEALLKVFQSAR